MKIKDWFTTENPVVEIAETLEKKTEYPTEVQQIHAEFLTAADRLLIDAANCIKEADTKNASKVNRLEALGFKQASEVQELKPIMQKAQLSKEMVALVEYYTREYPLYKFITEEQIKSICFKYGLVYTTVDRYKGFVPDKNLKEIENFKLKKSEQALLMGTELRPYLGGTAPVTELVFKDAKVKHSSNDYIHIYPISSSDYSRSAFQSNDGVHFYGNDKRDNFGYKWIGDIHFTLSNQTLNICAPVKDVDMTGMTIEEGYKVTLIHIPDPVVLQRVKGGALVVMAWGDEASDPEVLNPIVN